MGLVAEFVDSLEGNLSGFLYRDPSKAGQPIIGVNTHHHPNRQNFTIAHELGHWFLHEQEQLHVDREFRVRLRDDVSSQGTDEAERQANLFAACLLMPKNFLEADLESEDYVDLLDEGFLRATPASMVSAAKPSSIGSKIWATSTNRATDFLL